MKLPSDMYKGLKLLMSDDYIDEAVVQSFKNQGSELWERYASTSDGMCGRLLALDTCYDDESVMIVFQYNLLLWLSLVYNL
jgi:hypothetical protein